MTKPKISLCMIVKNEAEMLPHCLNSVRSAVEEIILVDTGSTDGTKQIAEQFGATICSVEWTGDFAFARNIGLLQAKGTWILFLDADEELEEQHVQELRNAAEHLEYEGFFLQVHNHQGERKHSRTATINPILRMFRNRPEYRFKGKIHEQIAQTILMAKPEAQFHILNVTIHHYGYSEQQVVRKDKIARNVALLQEALCQEPNDPFHHYNMAVEYMRMQDYPSALEHLREALERCMPETSYRHLLVKYEARCLLALQRYEEAAAVCSQAIELYGDYTDLVHLLGVIQFTTGHKRQAQDTLTRAARMGAAPGHYHTEAGIGTYTTCYALGRLLEDTDEAAAAIHWYAEAVKHNAQMTTPLQRIFRLLASAGSESEIPQLITEKFRMRTPEAWGKVIRLLMEEGCWQAVLALLPEWEVTDQAAEWAAVGGWSVFKLEAAITCLAWSGRVEEAKRLLEREKAVGLAEGDAVAVEHRRLLSRLRELLDAARDPAVTLKEAGSSIDMDVDGANDTDEMDTTVEMEFRIRAAYFSERRALAYKLLTAWLKAGHGEANVAANPMAAAEAAYRKSRTLIALAEARLGTIDVANLCFSVYRKARLGLPPGRWN
ncbi:tetratricopeptide repeat-containing glycosyltransferase family 2 protein [Paenibacillus rigui]|uniref:Glycosyltransferase 2-like domain-containing protein n=1 Tax=Paenibacillus rigui TaxID=554312 RepID=A0A229UNX3_9BACL|nr:glycosyltransferase family 2 protein [Paenibacillus rigui]OXM85064.1 hypothetical protein CF651_15735 [Paenibacillus rigui]